MPTDPTPKMIVRRYLKALTNGTPAELARWAAKDIVGEQGSQKAQGLAALEHYSMTYRKLVSGWRIEIERMIAEGNWVSAAGRLLGKVDGRAIRIPFIAHYRVARGKVAHVVIAVDDSVQVDAKAASRSFPLEP